MVVAGLCDGGSGVGAGGVILDLPLCRGQLPLAQYLTRAHASVTATATQSVNRRERACVVSSEMSFCALQHNPACCTHDL